jgi:hypothetical protein
MHLRRSAGRGLLVVAAVVVAIICLAGCPKQAPPSTAAATGGPTAAPAEPRPPAPAQTEASVTLNAQMIDQWLACMKDPKVKAIMEQLKPSGKVSFAQMAANADKDGADPALQEAIQVHGYSSGAEWAAVTKRMHAGLISMELEVAKQQAKRIEDPAKAQQALAAIDAKMREAEEAFGELTDDEMKLIEAATKKPASATK